MMLGSFGLIMAEELGLEQENNMYTEVRTFKTLLLLGSFVAKKPYENWTNNILKQSKPRPETRTNCEAKIGLKNMGENWMVHNTHKKLVIYCHLNEEFQKFIANKFI
jgi:hypothetical protein